MAKIKPFYGIRPRKELAGRVAALPYDVYNREEARIETRREPLSFLRVDRAETQFEPDTDMYAPEVYQKAHDLLWDMVKEGVLVKEEQPCFYLYELTMNGRAQTGLVACASVDDYINGVIRKHENTRADKEIDRIKHVDACDAQTGPIFLAYRYNETIHNYIAEAKQNETLFDFVSEDGIRHRGWKIAEQEKIEHIAAAFAQIGCVYIADGHHRAASAVKVSLMRREEAKKSGVSAGKEFEYDYFLSVLFSHEELCIMDYNRVVKDLNGWTQEEFLEKLSEKCDVRRNLVSVHTCEGGVCRMETKNEPFKPQQKNQAGMYLGGKWYQITFKKEYCVSDCVNGLDVSILQREILAPMLGIKDPKTDGRITFVGGIRGLAELERQADACGGVAFAMFPTSMEELFAVADQQRLMPPKSTWFEPKLRSGLFIHALR